MAIRIDSDKVVIGNFEIKQNFGGLSGNFNIIGYPLIPNNIVHLTTKNPSFLSANGTIQAKSIFNIEAQAITSLFAGGFRRDTTLTSTVEKIPFSTRLNSRSVGNLTVAKGQGAGQSSKLSGYISGGTTTPTNTTTLSIDRFPFVSESVNAVSGSSLSIGRRRSTGHSSTTHGYNVGGTLLNGTNIETIDKFPFASDGASSITGNAVGAAFGYTGFSSETTAYSFTGPPTGGSDFRTKFNFSNDTSIQSFGSISTSTISAGLNSPSDGFIFRSTTIEKFPFASETYQTVGYLYTAHPSTADVFTDGIAAASGLTSGLLAGGATTQPNAPTVPTQYYKLVGQTPPTSNRAIFRIDSFPFVSNHYTSYVGDLQQERLHATGMSDR